MLVAAVGVGWCLNGGDACGSGWVMGRGGRRVVEQMPKGSQVAGRWVMVVAVGVGWCLNGGGACGSGWVMGRGRRRVVE